MLRRLSERRASGSVAGTFERTVLLQAVRAWVMPRSHPPALTTIVHRTLKEECAVARGQRWLVAVSGGPDSLALLHTLARAGGAFGLTLAAQGIDHGLRSEAREELDLARRLAEALGVPYFETRVHVSPGGNLQARARRARLDALEAAARRHHCQCIATGHHADDRAETVLIRLLGGATPRGLAVLPARDGARVRPLVRARRADILRHLERHGIVWAADPSNADRRFLRARVRHELLPLLEELSPAIVAHLNGLADEAGAEPIPPLVDDHGQPVALRRAHRAQIRQALANGRQRSLVRLPGDRQVQVDPRSATLTLVPDDAPGRSGRSGG